jgi:hypothetical protein
MVQYEPCPKGWYRVGARCVKRGSRGKIHRPAKIKHGSKPPPPRRPGPGGTGIPNPVPSAAAATGGDTGAGGGVTSEPFTGTLTPAVADTSGGDSSGDTGTTAAAPGGDLTGTSAIATGMHDAVFGSGVGYTPQLHYDLQAMQQETVAQQMTAQPAGTKA